MLKCANCDCSFIPSVSKWSKIQQGREPFCSKTCKREHRIKSRLRTCEWCDTEFEARPSQLHSEKSDRNYKLFCRMDCKRAAKDEAYKRSCEHCSKDFVAKEYQIVSEAENPNYHFFCSKPCKVSFNSDVECANCSKIFTTTFAMIRYKKDNPDYSFVCSKDCKGKERHKKLPNLYPNSITAKYLDDMKADHAAGHTLEKMGKKYGVSKERIRQVLNRAGVKTSWAARPDKMVECLWCKKKFGIPRSDKSKNQFCSEDCKKARRRDKIGPPTHELYDWLECHHCKNWFLRTVQRSRIHAAMARRNGRIQRHTYCTKSCYAKHLRTNPIGSLKR